MADTAAPNAPERLDPRIRRTRQMLFEALERLLQQNSIEQLSVADITDAATLNRATFYDHYADKFSLLDDMVEERFQQLMTQRGVAFDGTCAAALNNIILATCDYLASLPGMDCPNRRQMEKYFESAIISVVRGLILSGLRQHGESGTVRLELTAAVISGAIYGGAREWVRTSKREPVKRAVKSIFALVHPIMAGTEAGASPA